MPNKQSGKKLEVEFDRLEEAMRRAFLPEQPREPSQTGIEPVVEFARLAQFILRPDWLDEGLVWLGLSRALHAVSETPEGAELRPGLPALDAEMEKLKSFLRELTPYAGRSKFLAVMQDGLSRDSREQRVLQMLEFTKGLLMRLKPDEAFAEAAAVAAIRALFGIEEPERSQALVLPEHLPQQTFQEGREVQRALSDAGRGERWEAVVGEVALRYIGEGFDIKLVPSSWWTSNPPSIEGLQRQLRQLHPTAAILYNILVGLAVQTPDQFEVSLDELMARLAWRARNKVGRRDKRWALFELFCMFDATHVWGCRPGTYRDAMTREKLDLHYEAPLLQIRGVKRVPDDGGRTPVSVTLQAGAFIERFRGNRQVLSSMGDVLRIAAIPAGKPSGAWAQAIGLALNQTWREGAARAETETKEVGDDKHHTIRFRSVTRRKLLTLFSPRPSLDEVLNGPHPRRAIRYWNGAIRILLKGTTSFGRADGSWFLARHGIEDLLWVPPDRIGWQRCWYEQPLDMRPAPKRAEDIQALAEIGATARRRRKK